MNTRRRLVISPSGVRDLENIAAHIAEYNHATSIQQIERIIEKANALRDYPEMGIVRERLAHGLRSIVEGPYVVFYYPRADRIEIVRVFHSRQDIEHEFISFISTYFNNG